MAYFDTICGSNGRKKYIGVQVLFQMPINIFVGGVIFFKVILVFHFLKQMNPPFYPRLFD